MLTPDWLAQMGVGRCPSLRGSGSGYARTAWHGQEMLRYWHCVEIPWTVLPQPVYHNDPYAASIGPLLELHARAEAIIAACWGTPKPVRWLADATIATRDFDIVGREAVMLWLHLSQ